MEGNSGKIDPEGGGVILIYQATRPGFPFYRKKKIAKARAAATLVFVILYFHDTQNEISMYVYMKILYIYIYVFLNMLPAIFAIGLCLHQSAESCFPEEIS